MDSASATLSTQRASKIPDMSKFADIQIDPAIVRRAASGDSRAHEIIYRAFATPVYSMCLRFTKVPAQAEDLVQETFIEVMRSIAKFRGEAALGSWIRRIAVKSVDVFALGLDAARAVARRRLARGHPRRCGSHGVSSQPDDALDLDAALANLPDGSRGRLVARRGRFYAQGDRCVDGKTESFSKSQLSRAYQRLRPMLSSLTMSSQPKARHSGVVEDVERQEG